jgi:hypothetical protein
MEGHWLDEELQRTETDDDDVQPYLSQVVKVQNLQDNGDLADLDSTVTKMEILNELLNFEHAPQVASCT